MDKIIVCIPARYQSTRLPGKPLLTINNKTIIHHVYDNVAKLKNIDEIVVLTDDNRIKDEVESFGGNCCIITDECLNGTDRIIRYLKKNIKNESIDELNKTSKKGLWNVEWVNDTTVKMNIPSRIIVNVQGDEPFINHNNIQLAIDNYIAKRKLDEKIVCSTLFYKTRNQESIRNKSRGKAVLDLKGNIMYCSRNIIPSGKKQDIIPDHDYNIHIGIFVFNENYLLHNYFNNNTPLQLCEDIEWMKIMEQGFKINAVEVAEHEIGVDTIDDYNYLKNKYTNC